jgi:hypothetical protein
LELAFITGRSSLASCFGFTIGSSSEEHRLELLVLVSIHHIFDYFFFITTILRTSLRNQKRYFGEAALHSFEYATMVFITPQVLQYFAWAIIHVSIACVVFTASSDLNYIRKLLFLDIRLCLTQ